ncbi:alpha-ketoglutarate catabolism dioxygenase [Peniophora sp. CONT]|nr:alpha-ketoglutarate catabolism dioxygenase [Peniophora sp. CONT]
MASTLTQTIANTANDFSTLKLTGEGEPPSKAADGNAPTDGGPKYPRYYPVFNNEEKWPPLEYVDHHDRGLDADPTKPNLLAEGVEERILSPFIGSELRGVQLSQLSPAGLDELALHVAQRKVVVLRDQDFKDIGPERQVEIANYFGPIHRHPTSGNIEGFPEFHVVYRDASHNRFDLRLNNRINHTSWHSDVSYEKQTPGTTLFFILEQPPLGGDTIFASQVEAYNRLSPEFKKRLEGLRALHSAVDQAEFSRKENGPVRREPIETEHPLVRVHPVTGEKALYINQGFTRRIVDFKAEESEYLLKFLFDHISKGADFQVRASYEPGTVVLWDNRITVHSATPDYARDERRHAVRLTPQAEKPIPATA